MKPSLEVLFYNFSKEKIPKKEFFVKEIKKYLKKLKEKKKVEIALIFVSSKEIRKLNYYWRKKNQITSVLSFKSNFSSVFKKNNILKTKDLGEIVFCPSKIEKMAKKEKKKSTEVYSYLLAHSLLHLYGFTHSSSFDSLRMIKMEKFLLENKK